MMVEIMTMRFPWNLWVIILAAVNFVGGFYFYETIEGKTALISMIGAIIVMQIIYSRLGFVKLMGLGHILFWIPFLGLSLARLWNWNELDNDLRYWLLTVSLVNTMSLILDIYDVVRFIKGETTKM